MAPPSDAALRSFRGRGLGVLSEAAADGLRRGPFEPRARTDGVLVREIGDELLVYDLRRLRAHCLNPAAALVFRMCDGQTSPAEMAHALRGARHAPADEGWVSLALDRLAEAEILDAAEALPDLPPDLPHDPGPELPPDLGPDLSRRRFLGRTGRVAGLAALLPAVVTIVAPTPAEASASCVTDCSGQPFGTACRNSNPSDCGLTCVCNGSGSCTQLDGMTACP